MSAGWILDIDNGIVIILSLSAQLFPEIAPIIIQFILLQK